VKNAALVSLLLGAAACNPLAFNDLADEVWVDSSDKPDDVNSDGYAAALAYGGSGGSGAGVLAVATTPPYVVLLDYNGSGGLEKLHEEVRQGLSDAESLPPHPAIATVPREWGADGPSAFLGVSSGGEHYLLPIQAQTLDFAGSLIRLVDADSQAVAIAAGDVTDTGPEPDIVAVTRERVYLLADYTSSVNSVASSCLLDGGQSVVVNADGQITIGTADGVRLLLPFNIPGATDPEALPDTPPACGGGAIPAPDVIDGFGTQVATGDFDEDGEVDTAVSAPESDLVLVSFGSNPSAWIEIDSPDGSHTFGEALAAGDLDHDSVDDLIVGDPGYDAEAGDAGAVHVYRFDGEAPELASSLFDADPEEDQRFGQSVAVVDFDGDAISQILSVGATDEVFTYFRVTADATDVRH
jgi:hypothetical protein